MNQSKMPVLHQTGLGEIGLAPEVFEAIAQIALGEVTKAVVGTGSLFKVKKPITCIVNNGKLELSLELKIRYGANVSAVCAEAQEKIHTAVSQMTDFTLSVIDVKVVGIEF